MSQNPYAPPKAEVSSEPSSAPQSQMTRPREIVWAVQLAALNYALGITGFAVAWSYFAKLQPPVTLIIGQVFGLAIIVWIYYKIYVGRNWARIVLLVFALLGSLSVLNPIALNIVMAGPLVTKITKLGSIAINLAILWLLFISPGRHWFAQRS